jgi:hypothetical protein
MLKTIHDRLVDALIAHGAELVPHKTEKYTVLARSGVMFFFVGRNGALRLGRTITDSRSVPPAFKARLLAGATTFANKRDARSPSGPVMRLDTSDETG